MSALGVRSVKFDGPGPRLQRRRKGARGDFRGNDWTGARILAAWYYRSQGPCGGNTSVKCGYEPLPERTNRWLWGSPRTGKATTEQGFACGSDSIGACPCRGLTAAMNGVGVAAALASSRNVVLNALEATSSPVSVGFILARDGRLALVDRD